MMIGGDGVDLSGGESTSFIAFEGDDWWDGGVGGFD